MAPAVQNLALIWLPAFAFLAIVAMLFRRMNSVHARRERRLEGAVLERTQELERERRRERSRNRILEMLVADHPLGTILDEVARLVCADTADAVCAIVLMKADGPQLVAAPGASAELVAALETSHAIPFEVWKRSAEFPAPSGDPAWKILMSGLEGQCPAAIRSCLIGNPEIPLGTCLVFENSPRADESAGGDIVDAARLAQLAIEHCRVHDDLSFQAHHDNLTGLPNRLLFEHRLSQAVYEARVREQKAAVLYLDLDRFKQINDAMSHRVGDLFLAEIAQRMQRAVRPGDTVARIGGDEFNVLLACVGGMAEVESVAARILEAVRQPVEIEGRSIPGSASIGVAIFPDDATEPEELQRQADAAMYCAKGLGRDRVQSFSTRNNTLDRVRMDQDLKKSLRDRLFTIHYQPKVDQMGGFAGLEALLRLNHPVHGPIPPSEFIPIAEESGLIVPLGAWVLDEVCRQMAEWAGVGLGNLHVAVNVSPLQICRPDFAAGVEECLRSRGVPPSCLELELTESLLIGSGEQTQKQMRYLRGLGIRFSIDDFGTGYSSLSYLHRLQVDAIKLDRSFVKSIDTDEAARRLVQAMIGVAEGLGLDVIAEGVETEAQRMVLIAAGCPTMQGFLFSKPRTAAELEGYLRAATSNTDDLMRIETACHLHLSAIPDVAAI